MITAEKDRQVMTNVQNSSGFNIENNAKMFSILSSGIYEDPIRAIIRELSCNAYDSHIDAGTPDQPFRVRLPSRFDPRLQIEDYGVGLDHDGVVNVYTVYGKSTKTNSNDVIGALGLGSKTPFSYSETFTIRSRKDGMERWYNAYIGNEGFPTISMLSEKPTEEDNGLMIEVAVKESDCARFRDKAIEVFNFFKMVPEGLPYSIEDQVQKHSDEMYKEFEEKGFCIQSCPTVKFTAVMGNIAYRIPTNIIENHRPDMSKFLSMKLGQNNYHVILPFAIGDLDIAASRESLSFFETDDDTTFNNILKKLDETIGVYIEEIQGKIDQCDNWQTACQYVIDERLKLVAGLFTFRGKPMDKVLQKIINFDVLMHHKTVWSETDFNAYRRLQYDYRMYTWDGSRYSTPMMRQRELCSDDCLTILYNDTDSKRGVPTAIHYYKDKTHFPRGAFFIGVVDPMSKDNFDRIRERIPNVKFVPVSPVIAERNAKMASQRSTRPSVGAYESQTEIKARWMRGCDIKKVKKWDVDQLRKEGTRIAYFMPKNGGNGKTFEFNGNRVPINELNSAFLHLLNVDMILFANKTNIKRIKKNNIQPIEDVIKRELPLLKKLLGSLVRVENDRCLDVFLNDVANCVKSSYTTTSMDRYLTRYLYENGQIKFDQGSTEYDHRFMRIIGAKRLFKREGASLDGRLNSGEMRLRSTMNLHANELIKIMGDDYDIIRDANSDASNNNPDQYEPLVNAYIEAYPVLTMFSPSHMYGEYRDDNGMLKENQFDELIDKLFA